VTIDIVQDVIKNLLKHTTKREVTVEDIIKAVGKKMSMKAGDIKSPKKNKNLVLARQIVMYLARRLTHRSFPDIGEKVGGRDHSTVIYSNNKIQGMLEKDYELRKIIKEIEMML
jgi:chromosomal replication initiator protein